eukprot:m.33059 g.33059  ORF g.33059 m.33059 type:complete len:80 (-) comp6426_c0_seq2:1500-1739(-)
MNIMYGLAKWWLELIQYSTFEPQSEQNLDESTSLLPHCEQNFGLTPVCFGVDTFIACGVGAWAIAVESPLDACNCALIR